MSQSKGFFTVTINRSKRTHNITKQTSQIRCSWKYVQTPVLTASVKNIFGVALTKGVVARIGIRNAITSGSVCGRTYTRGEYSPICTYIYIHIYTYRERAILYRSACPPLGYAECVLSLPGPPRWRRRNYRYLLPSASTLRPPLRRPSISSSSVRRRNNLIPYSRGGCRPWRIEWNKIKPRIPRVLWRSSFPTPQPQRIRLDRVRACLHTVEHLLRVFLIFLLSPFFLVLCRRYVISFSVPSSVFTFSVRRVILRSFLGQWQFSCLAMVTIMIVNDTLVKKRKRKRREREKEREERKSKIFGE